MTEADDRISWINSEPGEDGKYVLTVSYDADHQQVLAPEQAHTQALIWLKACAAAEHDAAIFRLLCKRLNLERQAAAEAVVHLRARRTNIFAIGPLAVTPSVSAFTGQPFVIVAGIGEPWQWSTKEARGHAEGLQMGAATLSLDDIFYDFLITDHKIKPVMARTVVADLANFREEV